MLSESVCRTVSSTAVDLLRMKELLSPLRPCLRLAGILALLATVPVSRAPAQIIVTNPPVPLVTIVATDPIASVAGDTGTFTVFRYGDTNATLNVYYDIGGTASNGVDYAQISHFVTIPAGVGTNTITIKPINHGQTNIQTVVLQLGPSPLMTPVNYTVGSPGEAVVFIEGNGVTNLPPAVRISTPANGQVFYSGVVCPPCLTNNPPCLMPCYVVVANIPICADARDLDGYVATVEFFAGTNSLGVRTNCLPCANMMNPFCLVWSNVPPGNYVLTAVATDNGGASGVSAPVNILVLPAPPPTNRPPAVRITSPPDGASFRAPVNIPVYAYAFDPDGFVAAVEFFDGTNDLGPGHVVPCAVPLVICSNCPPPVCPYLFVWTNAPLGSHVLTAIATANGGASTISPPVNVTVLPPPPPVTNRPPIVTIVATDPLAIEGTNCWVWPGVTNAIPTWSNWPVAASACRFFTNCGPKDASFTVRRFGDTNDALTVTYAIGGTATNGVDYITLPGVVTIPAGERAAMITVVPIDNGPPEITSTVILKLLSSTNTPQDYLVGFPGRAAALILDGPFLRPPIGILPGPCFHLGASGPNGAWFRIEYSTDLLNWTPICVNQVVNGAIDFVDPDAQTTGSRFYRAVPELNPPLQ